MRCHFHKGFQRLNEVKWLHQEHFSSTVKSTQFLGISKFHLHACLTMILFRLKEFRRLSSDYGIDLGSLDSSFRVDDGNIRVSFPVLCLSHCSITEGCTFFHAEPVSHAGGKYLCHLYKLPPPGEFNSSQIRLGQSKPVYFEPSLLESTQATFLDQVQAALSEQGVIRITVGSINFLTIQGSIFSQRFC